MSTSQVSTKVLLLGTASEWIIQDPLDPRYRTLDVELPSGYYRVWRGALKPGDRYLNMVLARDGLVVWVEVDAETLQARTDQQSLYRLADRYGCLIRKGTSVEQPCERCKMLEREPQLRYCWYCAAIVVKEGRKQCRRQRR